MAFIPPTPFMRGRATGRFASTWFQPPFRRDVVLPLPHCGHTGSNSSLNMNFLSDVMFDFRSNALGFAGKDEVKAAADKPNAIFLDVRSQAEIAAASLSTGTPVVHATCSSASDCPALKQLPKDKDAPVLVFCASGKRASQAKVVLEAKGYTNVLNAGGLSDLGYLSD